MRKISNYIGGAVLVLVSLYAIAAYFVMYKSGGQWLDGLGRHLGPSPWFLRLVLGEDRLWAGPLWFVVDLSVFWGGVLLAITLFRFGDTPEAAQWEPVELNGEPEEEEDWLCIYETPPGREDRRGQQ